MNTLILEVSQELSVNVLPDSQHEFLMTTKEVAKAYGVHRTRLSHHVKNHCDELFENKHFIKGYAKNAHPVKGGTIRHTLGKNAQPHQVYWTKRGIVRLGFFIKSERARMFRDWAEDLIIRELESESSKHAVTTLPTPPKRKHNRLTLERLTDIMYYVCMIEDKNLRMILSEKLKG